PLRGRPRPGGPARRAGREPGLPGARGLGLPAAGSRQKGGRRGVSTGANRAGDGGAQKVFICYRREETAAHAGRLYDAMVARFGESNVFMDIELEPGIDFVDHITQVVGSCHVLLVILGPKWA